MKRLLVLVVVLVLVLVSIGGVSASDPFPVVNSFQSFLQPSTTYRVFITTAMFNGVSRSDLFNFMAVPENDWQWYPGIVSETQLSGDPGGSTGATYSEVFSDGVNTWENIVTLDVFNRPRYLVQKTIGPVKSWSLVVISRIGNRAIWTSYSIIQESPLLQFDAIVAALSLAYSNVAQHFGTTQVSNTINLGTITTDGNGQVVLPFDLQALASALP